MPDHAPVEPRPNDPGSSAPQVPPSVYTQDEAGPRPLPAQDAAAARASTSLPRTVQPSGEFSRLTWAMIVVAGLVLGGVMALMAAGA